MEKTPTEELIRTLCACLAEDSNEEVIGYALSHEYFDTDFFDELERVRYLIADRLSSAEKEIGFLKAHENDLVWLDRDTKRMYYNDMPVPAYWYSDDMSDEEVVSQLAGYRRMWLKNGLEPVWYPLLEEWHRLQRWEAEFEPEELRRMEKDLEAPCSEEAKVLRSLFDARVPIEAIRERYPFRIRKILKTENKKRSGTGASADVTCECYDGHIFRVHIRKDKGLIGISSLDGRGFPYLTDRDEKILMEELG